MSFRTFKGMMNMGVKRVFLIVLDSFGIGELPDAGLYGDTGSNTINAVAASKKFDTPNLARLGLFNIDGVTCREQYKDPIGAFARMSERSKGKDTTIGHWEIAGIVSDRPLPTYPHGFPQDILDKFTEATGRKVLCNRPYSGTDVIRDYGREHVETGALIVYTSADSVFQIAAHEDVVPLEKLYEYCQTARNILTGEHGVGRVIARPFTGAYPDFKRTSNRHDFSIAPPRPTMLDYLKAGGYEVIAVGKINDIFSGKGVSESIKTANNSEGMARTMDLLDRDFNGICFTNLVDFDMLYGHRNDVEGYAAALTAFDIWLEGFMKKMHKDDVLIITADHGCDPSTESTDHSREYTPLLVYGYAVTPAVNAGTRSCFSDISSTILDMFGAYGVSDGQSMLPLIMKEPAAAADPKASARVDVQKLAALAFEAKNRSYSPYSHFAVGAALLAKSGKVYLGCNIENAAFTPTNCAERTAFFKAVSEGEREFEAIAIAASHADGRAYDKYCTPCGVCRQVMMEFCDPDTFKVIATKSIDDYSIFTLKELLPLGFGPSDMKPGV